jgi:hypothetical protein
MITVRRGMTLLVGLAALAAAPLAAQAPPTTPASKPAGVVATGKVEFVSIEPAKGTVLKAGANVSFKARVRYHRSAAGPAQFQLLVQDQSGKPLLQKPPAAKADKADGEVELKADVTIPKEGVTAVHVYVPMFSLDPAAKGTSTATGTKYTVAP